ncbi:MAG: DUF1499 domain-containing protein [Acetobacteraceae bacterium]
MTVFAWLLGLLLPACGTSGTQGLPTPAPFDVARIERGASPNTALAAPTRFASPPDIVTPVYPVPPKRLYAAVRAAAAAQPLTFLAAENTVTLQAQWVARSRLLNFPDLVAAQVLPATGDASSLVLYSRSVYGYSDLGANRRRLHSWLAAIEAAVAPVAR